MTQAAQNGSSATPRTFASGYLFGVPVGDLGWFSSLLISGAVGFAAFFAATFFAIFGVLFYNTTMHHTVDYALSYRRVGLPVGLVVLAAALAYMGTLWVRRKLRKA